MSPAKAVQAVSHTCPPWMLKLAVGWVIALVSFVGLNFVFNPLGDLRKSVNSLNMIVMQLTTVVEAHTKHQVQMLGAVDDLALEVRSVREAMIRGGIEVRPSK